MRYSESGYSESQKKSSNEIVLALLPMVPLFVVSALRVNVGTDYKNYLRIYSTFIQEGIQGRLEPGFYYLCRLIDFCNLPSQMIFVVSSAMILFFIALYIWKESPSPCFSIFLFVFSGWYFSSMNIVRQAMAISICMYGIHLLLKHRSYFFIIIATLVASLFHRTALIFLLIAILIYLMPKSRLANICITSFILAFMPHTLSYLVELFEGSTYMYFFLKSEMIQWQSVWGLAIYLSIFIFANIYYCDSEKFVYYYKLLLIAICLCYFGFCFPEAAARFKFYLNLTLIIFIPMILENIKRTDLRRLYKIMITICYIAYSYVVIVVGGAYGVLPYRSIL